MSKFTADKDPADFTVDEVTAFLATASPEDTATVQGAEGAEGGKARKGILEFVADPEAVNPSEDGYTRAPVPEDQAYVPGPTLDDNQE